LRHAKKSQAPHALEDNGQDNKVEGGVPSHSILMI
jgi:hypothetical protein